MPSVLARTSIVALALCVASCHGASVPQARQTSSNGVTFKGQGGASKGRLSAAFSGDASNATANTLQDSQDLIYMVDIVIGKQAFTVQFDTGSTDLWVTVGNLPVTILNTTDITATETYGRGEAKGPINFAEVKLGGYTIPSQAFINAASAVDFPPFPFGGAGILGMSFDNVDLSPINAELEAAWGQDTTLGASPIANIFSQNPTTPNSFDVLLDRTSDLNDTSTGTFLIGEHHPNFASITQQPKLPRQFPGRWTVALQGMSVNGQSVSLPPGGTTVAQPGQLVMLLDTGFSLPPIPQPLVDAIYSSIPGAVQYTDSSALQWLVPCTGGTNITFNFGGVDFPIHSLDLTVVDTLTITDSNGQDSNVTYCYNAFQYTPFDPSEQGFDGAMGDSYLRNAYVSFDYGDSDSSGNNSFMQMLPTTDANAAWSDFIASRAAALQQLPPVIDPKQLLQLLSPDNGDSSGGAAVKGFGTSGAVATPDSSSDDQLTSLVEKYGPIIIGLLAGNVVIGLLLLIVGLVTCLRHTVKSGAQTKSIGASYAPVRFKEAEAYGAGDRETYHD